jgi:hypothetical protein
MKSYPSLEREELLALETASNFLKKFQFIKP